MKFINLCSLNSLSYVIITTYHTRRCFHHPQLSPKSTNQLLFQCLLKSNLQFELNDPNVFLVLCWISGWVLWLSVFMWGGPSLKCACQYPVTVHTRVRVCVVMWLEDCCEAALVSLACQLTPSALHMKGPGCVGGQEKERTRDVEGVRGRLCIYLHLVGICIVH